MDPIRNIGFPEYPKVDSSSTNLTGNGEKFSLAYEEPKDEKEKIDELKEQGVLLELSGQAAGKNQTSAQQTAKKPNDAVEETDGSAFHLRSFLGSILQKITSVWQSIAQSISKFWNDDGQGQNEQTEEGDLVTPSATIIRDTDAYEALLTQETSSLEEATLTEKTSPMEDTASSEAPTLAKNSDLLTYYDRTGRIVTVQGSDRNRILNGDKGTTGL
ncbi:MAG: hypothetical protein ACI4TB_05820 [Lachnospiraceae bacterium]